MLDLFQGWFEPMLAAAAGLAIGGFFFGSLWWSVRRTLSQPSSGPSPSVAWHLGSLLLRMAVTVLGFYAVGAGQWQRLLACLVGFLIARIAVSWWTSRWLRRQPSATSRTQFVQPGAEHAPES